MPTEGARTGRPRGRGLESTSWLLVLTALSCTIRVPLPGVGDDASDAAGGGIDMSTYSRPDVFHSGEKGGGSEQCSYLGVASNSVEMMLALDHSQSMQQTPFGTTTRWQAAKGAILDTMSAHPGIWFGLDLFPASTSNCGVLPGPNPLFVEPGPNTRASIESNMGCSSSDAGCPSVGNDSPSHVALPDCLTHLANEGTRGALSQFVLLVTDHAPTCAGDDPSHDQDLCNYTAGIVAKFENVQVFIVSLSDDKATTGCLSSIAAARPSYYYDPEMPQGLAFAVESDSSQLGHQLDSIMGYVEENLCRFSLIPPSDNPGPSLSNSRTDVQINGTIVPQVTGGSQSGWSSDGRNLVLSGTYCDNIKSVQTSPTPTVTICSPQVPAGGG